MLADVDDTREQIQHLEQRFNGNGPVMVALVSRRLEAIDKEAKLTGAYVNAATNPVDLNAVADKMIAKLVKDGHFDEIESAKLWLESVEAEIGVIG